MKGLKFIVTLVVTLMHYFEDKDKEAVRKTAYFNSKAKIITNSDEIEHELSMSHQEIIKTIENWVSNGSGWILKGIDGHFINFVVYQPLNGSSYIDYQRSLETQQKD